MADSEFTRKVKEAILAIPRGRVATYGQIAGLAGNGRAARQVAWILHSSSGKDGLPWQRVINSRGRISLKPGAGFEAQARRLKAERVGVDRRGDVDLGKFGWRPKSGRGRAPRSFEKFLKLLGSNHFHFYNI